MILKTHRKTLVKKFSFVPFFNMVLAWYGKWSHEVLVMIITMVGSAGERWWWFRQPRLRVSEHDTLWGSEPNSIQGIGHSGCPSKKSVSKDAQVVLRGRIFHPRVRERISRQESFEAWGPTERRVYARHVPEASLNAQETLQVRETHAAHIARALLIVNFLSTGHRPLGDSLSL